MVVENLTQKYKPKYQRNVQKYVKHVQIDYIDEDFSEF